MRLRAFFGTGARRAVLDPGAEATRQHGHGAANAGGRVLDLAWSPCGLMLATCAAGDPAVLVWDVASGECNELRCAVGALDRRCRPRPPLGSEGLGEPG